MAISEFTIKQNDTGEDISALLNDSNNTTFSLSGATVVFNMRSRTTDVVKINRASATIVDASTRQVKYIWNVVDTDTVDEYEAEFEVTFATGKIITFPNSLANRLLIHIVDDIA